MRRVRLAFVPGVEVEFVDRELALKRIEEWAGRSTRFPQVVFGPEGCGKTAWFKQSTELLKEYGFEVIYINPVEKEVSAEVGVSDVMSRLTGILREASVDAWSKAVWATIDLAKELIRAGRRKIAILADDVFQAIGLNRASIYVKGLLGLIEYPPRSIDAIVIAVATSEGVTRKEIGRHRWAELSPMWNMSREGFKKLYDQIPGDKPSFEEVWRLTGGNSSILARLYKGGWDIERIMRRIIEEKGVTKPFISRWRGWLEKAVEDPDALWEPEAPEELVERLIEMNLIMYHLYERHADDWIDYPPPEKDLELGIGRYVAWQTPLYRDAIKRALSLTSPTP